MPKYRTIFISDVHLGTKGCQAEVLDDFLRNNSSEKLYLVGDIIDGWKLQKRIYWPQEHSNVIRKVIGKARKGTKVYYIPGNHDEVLRKWMDMDLRFGRIRIVPDRVHKGVDGKKYYVVHGDAFDGITRLAPWVAWLGDSAYTITQDMNRWYNQLRKKLGMDYWSFSKFLKHNVKKAVDFIFKFEENITNYCNTKGYTGVICGHIHTPVIKDINGITYMNCGDWVENSTAIVEHHDGRFEVIEWHIK
jgi:UDP-2,3-diacylglucosamine pyrophosphatase LpxH